MRSTSAPLEPSALEALIGTDQRVIQDFLQDFDVSAARMAVELAEVCAVRQPKHAAAIANQLESSARSVGAWNLSDLCDAMEVAGNASDLTVVTALMPQFESGMVTVSEYLRSLQASEDQAARRA